MAETSLNVLIMCNKNWPHICYWDGFSSSATVLDNSPAGAFSVCIYQNTLVAACDNSNTIRWTETADITTWPEVNQVTVEPQWGHVTNLIGLDDRILVFCDKGILYLTGDLQSLPIVGVLHPEIGAARDMVTQFGSTIMFGFMNNLYVYDGGINIASGQIRDQLKFTPGSSIALSDKKAFVRFAKTAGQPSDIYCLDKTYFGGWSYFNYPSTTGIGQSNPPQGVVRYISSPWDCMMIPGGDGNLYVQPFIDQTDYIGKDDAPTSDALPEIVVTSEVKSRALDFGDRVLTKQFRRCLIYGEGENISITFYFTDRNKTTTEVTPALSGTSLPCQCTLPFLDGTTDSVPTEFNELSIKITGDNLLVQGIYVDFRQARYNLLAIQ